MAESERARFTLRPEYFGGLMYDANTARCILLEPTEYALLEEISQQENALFESIVSGNGTLRNRLIDFQKTGFIQQDETGRISLVSVRMVQPEVIPNGCLTAPIRVFDSYTLQCNLSCDHCMFSSNIFVHEPNRRTIDQTAEIMHKFYEAGTMEWRFTGGEAAIHPDLFDAMQVTRDLGMNYGLYTNGWWSEAVANKILDSGVYELVISLEGREETNDRRRRRGAFQKVMETFDRIREHNARNPQKFIHVTIAAAIGKDNMYDVDFLGDMAAQYGYNLNFMPLKPSGRARNTLSDQMPTTQEYMEFSQRVQQLRERADIKASGVKIIYKYKDLFCPTYPDSSGKPAPFNLAECGALTTAISLMPDGTLFSCPFILEFDTAGRFTGPNILTSSVQEAWLHPNFQKFRHVDRTETGCTGCSYYMKQCRGACKATVLGYGGKIEDGKLIGKDEYCYMPLMVKNN